MADRGRGYAHRVDIAADVQRVWRALTEVENLTRWCSPKADIRPRPGGLFRASVDRVTELEAHIDVYEPGRRMRLIYLPTPGLPPTDTPITDDFILEPVEFDPATGERVGTGSSRGGKRAPPSTAGPQRVETGRDGKQPTPQTGTIVRLLGSGVPNAAEWDTQYRRLRTGWQQAMARLKVFVENQSGERLAPSMKKTSP